MPEQCQWLQCNRGNLPRVTKPGLMPETGETTREALLQPEHTGNFSVGALFARAFIYALLTGGIVYLIMFEGYRLGTQSVYGEQSLTEWLEVACALISGVCFLLVARFDRVLRPAVVMLVALSAMMCIREADFLLDVHVFDGAWQLFVTAVLIGVSLYLWRQPESVSGSIRAYAQQPSAGVLLSGFLVLFVFSRLFGRESFWQGVMGERYQRVVKNIAEEGTEIMGYGLIMIAAIELLYVSLRHRGHQSPTASGAQQ